MHEGGDPRGRRCVEEIQEERKSLKEINCCCIVKKKKKKKKKKNEPKTKEKNMAYFTCTTN